MAGFTNAQKSPFGENGKFCPGQATLQRSDLEQTPRCVEEAGGSGRPDCSAGVRAGIALSRETSELQACRACTL